MLYGNNSRSQKIFPSGNYSHTTFCKFRLGYDPYINSPFGKNLRKRWNSSWGIFPKKGISAIQCFAELGWISLVEVIPFSVNFLFIDNFTKRENFVSCHFFGNFDLFGKIFSALPKIPRFHFCQNNIRISILT